jgi:threonine synthase
VRLDRQHVSLGRGVWRRCRDRGHRRAATWPDRDRQVAPGVDGRGARHRHRRQLRPVTLVNSVNPHRLEGQKTAAFEICDDLGRSPDILAIPVGNAGNISAYWAGFRDYAAAGLIGSTPRMWGFQAAGAAPLVVGHRIDRPETVATAIRIGDPASWTKAIDARDGSGGRISAVTDEEILAAYRALARFEGIFCEPASAASVAGVMKAAEAGEIDPDATVVCVLTGHGLKDPTTAERQVPPFLEAQPTVGAVSVALGW